MQRNPHSYQIATGYRTFYSLSLIYQPITKKRLFLNKTTTDQWGYNKSSINVSDDQNATALFSDTEALYFIPVNNKNGTTNAGDLKLKINYDIVTKVTDTSNLTSTITNKEVSLPKNTFKKRTKHTYVLTIKMNAIKITVEDNMEGWTDDSDSDINVEK